MQNNIIILNGDYDNIDACERVIKYAINSKYNAGVTANNVYMFENIKTIAQRFEMTRKIYGKNEGRKIYHIIISLDINYLGYCNVDIYAEKVVQYFRNYQVVAVQHFRSDKNAHNWHIHLIINAVSFITGNRFYANRMELFDFASYLKHLTNVRHEVIWDSEEYFDELYDDYEYVR